MDTKVKLCRKTLLKAKNGKEAVEIYDRLHTEGTQHSRRRVFFFSPTVINSGVKYLNNAEIVLSLSENPWRLTLFKFRSRGNDRVP